MCVVYTVCMFLIAPVGADLGVTLDVAGRQAMLTQQMSKEFILVSLGIDPEANKRRMHESIKLFNDSLYDMIHGNNARNISSPPTDLVASGLQEVADLWAPFVELLLKNVDQIRDAAPDVRTEILIYVSWGNMPLLVQSNVVVSNLAHIAELAKIETKGFVVDLAGRQQMLIQRMCKEAYLVASGVHVNSAASMLEEDQILFHSSHKGITRGAHWAGVPPVTKLCTTHQMSAVTYNYGLFDPLISEISTVLPISQNIKTAHRLAPEIEARSGPLIDAMAAAVSLYVNDPGTCNPVDAMTASGWKVLILSMADVMADSQMTVSCFLQMSNAVAVQQSTVSLIVGMNTVSAALASMIEGDKAKSIEAAPTQSLLDELRVASSMWASLVEDLQKGISSTEIPLMMATKVSFLSQQFQDKLEVVRSSLVEQATLSLKGTRYAVQDVQASVASLQSMMLAKMTMLVNLIFAATNGDAREIMESARELFNATRDAFLAGHRSMLVGSPGSDGKPTLIRLASVCEVQHMLKVYHMFNSVVRDSEMVLAGTQQSRGALEMLSLTTQTTYELTTSFASALVNNDTQDTLPCQNDTLPADDWLEMVVAVGDFRAFSQEACATQISIVASSGSAFEKLAEILAVKEQVMQKLYDISYGSATLPAPITQAIFEKLVETVEPPVLDFAESLEGGSGDTAVLKSLEVVAALNSLQDLCIAEATRAYPSVPFLRVDAASRQILLVQKTVLQAVMFVYEVTSLRVFEVIMAEFSRLHQDLKQGGSGLPPIPSERPDLLSQWAKVDVASARLKNTLKNMGRKNVDSLLASRDDLVLHLNTIRDLYKVPDPVGAEQFPWMYLAYGIMGCVFCGATCVAACLHRRACRSASDARNQSTQLGLADQP